MDKDALIKAATDLGFHAVGVAPVEPMGGGWFAPHSARLTAWLERGDQAEMKWIAERAHERTVPSLLLPTVKNAIVLWMNHRTADFEAVPYPTGKVAGYAWGRDYHNVVRKAVRKLERVIRESHPELNRYISIDTGAVLERAFAERSGIGWIGRSTMLINQKLGTFGSLAVMFTDIDLPTTVEAHPNRCGTCTDCVTACPTNALTDNGLDSRKCISYWTIEHRGLIPVSMRQAIGDWVFGCDICQDVCPWNHKAPPADANLWRPHAERARPDLIRWVQTDPEQLSQELLGSPLRRARGDGLRRNALIVLANGQYIEALPVIEHTLAHDPNPVIRATAAWAAMCLGSQNAIQQAMRDPDPMVRSEVS